VLFRKTGAIKTRGVKTGRAVRCDDYPNRFVRCQYCNFIIDTKRTPLSPRSQLSFDPVYLPGYVLTEKGSNILTESGNELLLEQAEGFVTADEGQTVLTVIKNLQTRLAELESKLQTMGLLVT